MVSWNENLDTKHCETLQRIFMEPPPSNLPWTDIQSLLEELVKKNRLGGIVTNTAPETPLRVKLDERVRADIYKPHPPEAPTIRPLILSIRDLLKKADVKPL